MAIAEHRPEELYARNRGLLTMSKGQLHDFAATQESGLPQRKHSIPARRRPDEQHRGYGGHARRKK